MQIRSKDEINGLKTVLSQKVQVAGWLGKNPTLSNSFHESGAHSVFQFEGVFLGFHSISDIWYFQVQLKINSFYCNKNLKIPNLSFYKYQCNQKWVKAQSTFMSLQ